MMKITVPFEECLKDSPKFRSSLQHTERDIHNFEAEIDKLVKLCTGIVDAGKSYSNASRAFAEGLQALGNNFGTDPLINNTITNMGHIFSDLNSFHQTFVEECQNLVIGFLQCSIKEEIGKVRDCKKSFDKMSDEFDTVVHRHASSQKAKTAEVEEAEQNYKSVQSWFSHIAFEYALALNVFQAKKHVDTLSSIMSLIRSYRKLFDQCSGLLQQFAPFTDVLTTQIKQESEKFLTEKKDMEKYYVTVKEKKFDTADTQTSKNSMEGYLFKRSRNTFKSWNRRYFTIQNNQLLYQKRSQVRINFHDFKDDVDITLPFAVEQTVVVDDLRLCLVKEIDDADRRFCFEIVHPTKGCVLQAVNNEEKQEWITAIQNSISAAFGTAKSREVPATDTEVKKAKPTSKKVSIKETSESRAKTDLRTTLDELKQIPGNDKCADCGKPDPIWASINLGIVLCIECSGIHRSLGVHVSRVKSATLDDWDPELVKVMARLGNEIVNLIFEHNPSSSLTKPGPNSIRSIREKWIQAKYVERSFLGNTADKEQVAAIVRRLRDYTIRHRKSTHRSKSVRRRSSVLGSPDSSSSGGIEAVPVELSDSSDNEDIEEGFAKLSPNLMLHKAAGLPKLPLMLLALALGGKIDWKNSDNDNGSAMHSAVKSGSLSALQFLILNGAAIDLRDGRGRSPLHYAVDKGNTGQVYILLKRGANQRAVDESGSDVLHIALTKTFADIVTLLRLARLNEEMREGGGYTEGDYTYNEVFKDFSHLMTADPKKLRQSSRK